MLGEWGAFGEKKMYGKTVQGVIRSTFVVDEKGKIEVAQYNVKAAHTSTAIQKIIARFSNSYRVRPTVRAAAFSQLGVPIFKAR